MRTSVVALTAAVILTLAGCGSSADDPAADPPVGDGDSSSPDDSSAPADEAVTVTPGSTCDALDKATITSELGITDKTFDVTNELEPGKKYVSAPGQPMQKATGWSCVYQVPYVTGKPRPKDDYTVAMYIPGGAQTMAAIDMANETLKASYEQNKKAKCTTADAPSWGPDGVVLTCSRPELETRSGGTTSYQAGNTSAYYRGLFGDVLVGCSVTGSNGNDPKVEGGAEKICADALIRMAE